MVLREDGGPVPVWLLDELLQLRRTTFVRGVAGLDDDPNPMETKAQFAALIQGDEPGAMVIARAGDRLIGYAKATLDRARGLGRVEEVAVHPDVRRQGYGTTLLERAAAELQRQGAISRIEVIDQSPSRATGVIAQRLGFQRALGAQDTYYRNLPWRPSLAAGAEERQKQVAGRWWLVPGGLQPPATSNQRPVTDLPAAGAEEGGPPVVVLDAAQARARSGLGDAAGGLIVPQQGMPEGLTGLIVADERLDPTRLAQTMAVIKAGSGLESVFRMAARLRVGPEDVILLDPDSLPTDPAARREQVMTWMTRLPGRPLVLAAGVEQIRTLTPYDVEALRQHVAADSHGPPLSILLKAEPVTGGLEDRHLLVWTQA